MIKKLLTSLVLAFSFLVTPPSYSAQCPPNSSPNTFMRLMVERFPTIAILNVNKEALDKVVTFLSTAKGKDFKVDKVLFGVFEKEGSVGVALFKDGCLVPDGTFTFNLDEYNLMVDAIQLLWTDMTLVVRV